MNAVKLQVLTEILGYNLLGELRTLVFRALASHRVTQVRSQLRSAGICGEIVTLWWLISEYLVCYCHFQFQQLLHIN